MTPEQIRRAKAIIEHAAVHSLETEEIQLLGWALQRIEELEAGRVVVARGKLLPCPCCGGDAEFAKEEGGGEYIECIAPNCHLSTALVYPAMDEAKPLLVERWSRRAIPDALRAQAGKDGCA